MTGRRFGTSDHLLITRTPMPRAAAGCIERERDSLLSNTHVICTKKEYNIEGWPEGHMPINAGHPWLYTTRNN